MKVEYTEHFLKDLKKLKSSPQYASIRVVCFEELPECDSLLQISHIKKMKGYKAYYRIRIGDYRIGIKKEGNLILFMRVLHRKDIYRFFPNPESRS